MTNKRKTHLNCGFPKFFLGIMLWMISQKLWVTKDEVERIQHRQKNLYQKHTKVLMSLSLYW